MRKERIIAGVTNNRALVLLVVLVMGMAVEGQSYSMASTFMSCYTPCFVLCYLTPAKTASTCALECLKDCIIPASASSPLDDRKIQAAHTDDNHRFCKLGCAASMCTHISTGKNPGGEKVERCVGSCSKMCTESYYYASSHP